MVYFQIHILQVQTLNITVKVVLSCKRTATHFMHVTVLEKMRERETETETETERRNFGYPPGIE
jgi:hypothetical protein